MELMGNVKGAPFVVKTYCMVSDPSADGVICWGRCNNSFVVVDPFAFSQQLLPSLFKHNNFSSFVRQLNTYGFRKIDADKWEFAHQCFLRGQTHLLQQIVRNNPDRLHSKKKTEEFEDEEEMLMAMEVERLKIEQRATNERLSKIWTRLHETEKKPKQMLAFLVNAIEDPQLLLTSLNRTSNARQEHVRCDYGEANVVPNTNNKRPISQSMGVGEMGGASCFDIK